MDSKEKEIESIKTAIEKSLVIDSKINVITFESKLLDFIHKYRNDNKISYLEILKGIANVNKFISDGL